MDFSLTRTNLEKLGYTVSEFESGADAAEYLAAAISGSTVGMGGSMTIKQMGLYEGLSKSNRVFWHWTPAEGSDAEQTRVLAQTADIYISSVNGMAETGEIVNIDGACNRVAGILYGHKKVYLIVGQNKIAADYDGALYRARNTAAPLNAKRLNRKTPCAISGDRCFDCASPERICRSLNVLWGKPAGCEYEVVLIHENLGY